MWQYGTKVHAKFWPWGTPWDPSYDHFWVLCWTSFSQYSIFSCIWGYMKVYKAIWRYIKVYEGVWRYIRRYEPTFSTLFFFNFCWTHFIDIVFLQLFEAPLFRHCFFSTFWKTHFYQLFFSFLRVYRPWEVAHLFSREIARRMPSEPCLGTPWGPSYDQFCRTYVFRKGRKGRGKRSP